MKAQRPVARILQSVGKTMSDWTVLAFAGDRNGKSMAWVACSCGEARRVDWNSIERGASRNCGCKRPIAKVTHGHTGTPEYQAFTDMMKRASAKYKCSNPETVANYKGRGITVCDSWDGNFPQFLADMGHRPSPDHSLDRIDNDKGYSPENCRWVTMSDQERNKRSTRTLTYNGETLCVADWARKVGINVQSIHSRLLRGWSVEKTLSTPLAAEHSTRRVTLSP